VFTLRNSRMPMVNERHKMVPRQSNEAQPRVLEAFQWISIPKDPNRTPSNGNAVTTSRGASTKNIPAHLRQVCIAPGRRIARIAKVVPAATRRIGNRRTSNDVGDCKPTMKIRLSSDRNKAETSPVETKPPLTMPSRTCLLESLISLASHGLDAEGTCDPWSLVRETG
jgi:hypothetical protein